MVKCKINNLECSQCTPCCGNRIELKNIDLRKVPKEEQVEKVYREFNLRIRHYKKHKKEGDNNMEILITKLMIIAIKEEIETEIHEQRERDVLRTARNKLEVAQLLSEYNLEECIEEMSSEEIAVIIKAVNNSIVKGMYKGVVKESIEKMISELKEGLEVKMLLDKTIEELKK